MRAIVAVDKNWGIGYQGKLLKSIPADMKFFKKMTLGKIVIMGRETYESLPQKKPLKDRVNIVLTKQLSFKDDRVKVCNSIEELLTIIEKYPLEDVFVIGGASVYAQLLSYCTEVYVTKINIEAKADRYLTNLDKEKAWEVFSSSEVDIYDFVGYNFVTYKNNDITK